MQPPVAPKAPTIADLLQQQGISPVTAKQDEARSQLMASLGGGRRPDPDDPWGNVHHAVNTAINYWAGQKNLEQAKAADQGETERQLARRQSVAEALASTGVAPEQAVSMATGAPEDNALVLELMGLNRQQAAAQEDRAFREQQAAAQQQRFAQEMGLKRDQFSSDRALRERQIAAASRPKEPSIVATLRHAGIEPGSPEGQQIIRDSLTGAAEGQNATEFGSIPSGMARVADPAAEAGYRLVPLEGSKQQVEAASRQEKRLGAKASAEQDLGSITRDINRVLSMSREGAGGPVEGQIGQIPGVGALTQSGQMGKHLDSIKANIAFGELQEMRNNSPTGGAVGSLTDKEREALSATVGSLDPALPEEDLQKNLIDYGAQRITAVHGTDAQIDAAVESGQISAEQAAEGKAIRDQQIAAMRGQSAAVGASPYAGMSDEDLLKALGQ